MNPISNDAKDEFISETHAEGKINFIKSCLDELPTNSKILSKDDWIDDWRPRIKNICEKTKNPNLKKRGEDVIAGFDRQFNISS